MPTTWTRPAYPKEVTKAYWQQKRAKLAQGQGVGKLCTALKTAYDGVDWGDMELATTSKLAWGSFTVDDWQSALDTASATLKGDCAKFSKQCYTTRDKLKEIEGGVSKAFAGTKTALKLMAAKADTLGVACNKNTVGGELLKMHKEQLAAMQTIADGLLPKLKTALKKVPKVCLEMGMISKAADDTIEDPEVLAKLNGLLFKGARDISQNTGNLAKVAAKGLAGGGVDMKAVAAANKTIAPWCNDASFFKSGTTKSAVKKVIQSFLKATEDLK